MGLDGSTLLLQRMTSNGLHFIGIITSGNRFGELEYASLQLGLPLTGWHRSRLRANLVLSHFAI